MSFLNPILHPDRYVFCTLKNIIPINGMDILMTFQESEGTTLILKKETAELHQLDYTFIASWITISTQTPLDMIGLTARFSSALAEAGIACNVVAAFYHDHIFVDARDALKAKNILAALEF